MISFLIGKERGNGDVGKAGSAVEATGEGKGKQASKSRPVEGVGARLELRRALLGLAGRRVFLGRGRRRRLRQSFGAFAVRSCPGVPMSSPLPPSSSSPPG